MKPAIATDYETLYRRAQPTFAGCSYDWLNALREKGLRDFLAQGFPDRASENWKYTPMTALGDILFVAPLKNNLSHMQLPLDPIHFQGHLLVFVGGYYHQELSHIGILPAGIVLTHLEHALMAYPEEVKKAICNAGDSPFTALNTAFMSDGLFLKIEDGVTLQEPIQCIFLDNANTSSDMMHYRHSITLGKGARADLVEYYIGTDRGLHFTNTLMQQSLGQGATLCHYKIQNENNQSYHVSSREVYQEENSHYISSLFSFGSHVSRYDIAVNLAEKNANCELNGFYRVEGHQHTDTHVRVDHKKPCGNSCIVFKGIACDSAKGVFNGKVVVHPGAIKTQSSQRNKNIVLSNTAEIDTKPELEIYADDVNCTHGATVGELDGDALFYLRSRGIFEEEAKQLLIKAFAEEMLEKVGPVYLRNHLSAMIIAKLQQEGVTHANED